MYCMYLRKSRADMEAEARGEGETLARHETMLLDLCKRMNLTVTKIYKEVVSGETISQRPVMQQLLKEVEQGLWKGVLTVEVERLARGDTMDQGLVAQTFKYSNTKIITPVKIYDPHNEFDEEYFEFGLFMSRREYKTINRRLQRGRLQSTMEGKYVASTPPYGYVRKKMAGQKGFTLEPHPDQAPAVKLIFDMHLDGHGLRMIAKKLDELKIPTIAGGVWSVGTIRDILTNTIYIGKVRWGYRAQVKKMASGEISAERPRASEYHLFDGLHPPLIDNDKFYKAQEIFAQNQPVPVARRYTIKNPMAGLIVCGKCGRKMLRHIQSTKKGKKYPDLIICKTLNCDNVSSAMLLVEEKLLQALGIWLDRHEIKPRAKRNNKSETMATERVIVKLEKEIVTLESQESKLHDLLEQGIYTVEVFLKRSTTLGGKLAEARESINRLKKELDKITGAEKGEQKIVPAVRKVLEIYRQLETPGEKNKLLKTVLEKVVYVKKVGGRWRVAPDDFELTLHPRLPK